MTSTYFKYFALILIVSQDLVDSSRQNIIASSATKQNNLAAGGINPWFCPSDSDCEKLDPDCLTCIYKKDCVYGNKTTGNCSVPQQFSCKVRK